MKNALMELNDSPIVPSPARDAAGSGEVRFRRVGGKTTVTRARANSPLKLLNPRSSGDSAWLFSSTFGGGLVAGDQISLDVDVGDGCSCLIGTQSATKVFRSPRGLAARQTLNVTMGDDAICVVAPHPVTCFAQARFVQRQRIETKSSSSLVLIDWLTSGRHASGERWAFDRYDSAADIFVDGRHVFRDALRLSEDYGPIDSPHRTGGFDCFAYAVVLGDAFEKRAQESIHKVGQQPVTMDAHPPLMFAAGPLPAGGAIFRAAGSGTEIVGNWLLKQLSFVGDALGSDRWSRMLQ
jgi:urease accessory protein